jgi:pilus assembly protein CpaF
MATPISSNFTRLTSADLLKFKRYLIENVGRSMEGELVQSGDRAEFMKQRLTEVYAQLKVNLPEDIRQQIFHDILDELTGFGPIQPLLDDPDIAKSLNGPNFEKEASLPAITFDDDDHVCGSSTASSCPWAAWIRAAAVVRLPDGSLTR